MAETPEKKHRHHRKHKHKKHKKHRRNREANEAEDTEQEVELDQIEYNIPHMDVIGDEITLGGADDDQSAFILDEHCDVSLDYCNSSQFVHVVLLSRVLLKWLRNS